jgi:hypothetical protein
MTTAIERQYGKFLAATDKAARFVGAEYQAHVLSLEREICDQLAQQPGGAITVGRIQFALVVTIIGGEHLRYFKTLIAHETTAHELGGFSFAKCETDILALASPEKPSLRRRGP